MVPARENQVAAEISGLLETGGVYSINVSRSARPAPGGKFSYQDPVALLGENGMVFIQPPGNRYSDYWHDHNLSEGQEVDVLVTGMANRGGKVHYQATMVSSSARLPTDRGANRPLEGVEARAANPNYINEYDKEQQQWARQVMQEFS